MKAFVVAVEGGDGVGKNTISRALKDMLSADGRSVTVIDFPRYTDTIAGEALALYLNGKTKRPINTDVLSVLYALDRFEFKSEIEAAIGDNDFVIFDRYVASNVAYQAAKVEPERRFELMEWIATLELEVFRLPQPDLNVLLRLDVAAAREMIERKAPRAYTALTHDIHEADDSLQERLRENYEYLVAQNMIANWLPVNVSEGGALLPPCDICSKILPYLVRASTSALP